MKIYLLQTIVMAAGIFGYANTVLAGPLFPAGVESKSVGMESSLRSQGAPAVLYNPANLYLTDQKSAADPYIELGMINVNYFYEHPQFDPVSVKVTTPTATIGYTHHFGERLNVGVVIFPSQSGETEVPGLPKQLGGSVQAIHVANDKNVTDIGIGMSTQPVKGISLGVSVVRTIEKHKLVASALDSETTLLEMEYSNNFDRVVLGSRFVPSEFVQVSLSMRPEQIKKYKGSQTHLGLTADPKVVNYEPQAVSIGFGGWVGPVEWGLEANHLRWAKGSSVVKDGVNVFAPEADLHDVIHTSASVGLGFSKTSRVRISYADLPSPWGKGHSSEIAEEQLHGADYGTLNAIDRKVIATGGEFSFADYDVDLSAYYSTGERKVDAEGANEGFYSLNIFSVSGSVRTEF